jgi:DNA-directed RNA polymerase subunit omega
MFAANRARQINQYYAELQAGSLFNNVGPLVEATVDEKALTIALREIDQNKLVKTATI